MNKPILLLIMSLYCSQIFSEDKILEELFYPKEKDGKKVLMYKVFATSKNELKFEAHSYYYSGVLFNKWVMDNEKQAATASYFNENNELIGSASFKGSALKPGENIDSPDFGLKRLTGIDIEYNFSEDRINIIAITNYKKEKRDGPCYEFYYDQNGNRQIKSFCKYKKDKLEGVCVVYNEKTGHLLSISEYKNDKVLGASTTFDENGRLTSFLNINAKEHVEGLGIIISYNDDGKVEQLETAFSKNEQYLFSTELKEKCVTQSFYNKKDILYYESKDQLEPAKVFEPLKSKDSLNNKSEQK